MRCFRDIFATEENKKEGERKRRKEKKKKIKRVVEKKGLRTIAPGPDPSPALTITLNRGTERAAASSPAHGGMLNAEEEHPQRVQSRVQIQ